MRENIQSLTGKSEAKKLIARYIAKADAQETRIEELRKEKETTVAEVARLRNEVTLAVKSLAFDRKL
jgi:cell division protein FtsB